MRFEFSTEDAVKKLTANIADWQQRQIPFAAMTAINKTAEDIKAEIEKTMPQVFDNPTPYILRGLRIKYATKKDLTASIEKKTGAAYALYVESEGGGRRPKAAERDLRAVGKLPGDKFIAPGGGARLDQYGNISRGQMIQILSVLDALPNPGANQTARSKIRNTKPGDYFVVTTPHGGLKPGIYERYGGTKGKWSRLSSKRNPSRAQMQDWNEGKTGRQVRPVLMFISTPKYSKRLSFERLGRIILKRNFDKNFADAWTEALRTAR